MSNVAGSWRIMIIALFVWFVLDGAASASNMTASTAQFDEAAKAYKEKKYSQSLNQFKQIHDAGQCNLTVHYYMGLCYQSLCQIASARQEFILVSRSENANLRTNALSALSAMESWEQHRLYKGSGLGFSRWGTAQERRIALAPGMAGCGPKSGSSGGG